MKKSLVKLELILILFCGCSKSDNSTNNPFGGTKGAVTFWSSNSTISNFPITVKIGGQYIGTIGGQLSSEPNCQNAVDKVVKFVAEPGTYNMYSTAASGGNWSGSITITTGACQTQCLK